MEALRRFAVLSILSMLVLSILPETRLRRTVQLVTSLFLLLSWLTALQALLPRLTLPESASDAPALSATAGYSFSWAQSEAENALARRCVAQEESP